MPRPPRLPDRDSFSGEEQKDFDFVYNRVTKLAGRPVESNPYVCACLVSPPFAASIWVYSGRMLAAGVSGKSYTHKEREHINVVLAFDFGHYEMVRFHLGYAVASAGLRREMVKALWEGREDDLLPDERQLVDYIREYVKGQVTDEMWNGLVARLGERGAVEYTLALGYHLMVIRGMQAFGTPTETRDEIQALIDGLFDESKPSGFDYEAHDRTMRELAGTP
jgi:hypothetical protein